MKALILNSGLGSRMGVLTSEHPKCMTEISSRETILSRQLKMIVEAGITDVVITTGYYDGVLVQYCNSLELPLHFTFVKNPIYDKTNYIYSIYCAREQLNDDILLMHGDLVFENEVLDRVMASESSCMTVSSTLPLPEKDFKARVVDGKIMAVGVDIFNEAMEAQALYKLNQEDWKVWLDKIVELCEDADELNRKVYAENALNALNGAAHIKALDVENLLCAEIDNPEDLAVVSTKLREIESRTVCDTGGKTEHFVYTVRSLERLGVSMVIIEDKTGLKKNSLFGTEVVQTQDTIENFSNKIRAGKKAQRTREFMICARIESLILEQGMEDALTRAFAFVKAGADAIMIHSRKKDPSEIQEFIEKFRAKDKITPIVLVPTSFNSVTEEEWKDRGANIIIYANQLMRAEVPAMQKAAETILKNHRAEECDAMLMPFKEIIRMIPVEV